MWFTEILGDRVARITTASGPTVVILTRRARVSSRGITHVKLACGASSGRCAGKLILTTTSRASRTTITRARARFSLAAGQRRAVKLRLNRAGRRRLARAKHHRLATRVRAIVSGGDTHRKLRLTAHRGSA